MTNCSDIDWNLEWKKRIERNEELKGAGCMSFWDTRESALQFYESSLEDGGKRVRWITDNIPYSPGSGILDVGSGPGTISIPLSRDAGRITAVEPSAAMAGVFREKIEENGIRNIDVVEKPWEEVDVDVDLSHPYETVFASFSLGMHDIRAAIEKMCSVSCGWVVLFHFAGDNSWEGIMREIWPAMHGREYLPGPKMDIIFNLLYSMDIYPDVVSAPNRYRLNYDSIDAAVTEFAGRFNASTENHYRIMRDYFSSHLIRDGSGYYMDMESYKMCIRWRCGD